MKFPLYRKYSNNLSFFKIDDETRFTELKLTGSNVEEHFFEAKILPDRNFIQDMIEMKDGHWVESYEREYLEVRDR